MVIVASLCLDGESAAIFLVVEQSKGVMQEDRTVLHLEYTWIIELIAISDGKYTHKL